ncbi:MAG: deaminase [Pseudomonadota bacterium]|nr:deaminase [Pseudomonadota bacterium]
MRNQLSAQLSVVGYNYEEIKVSSIIAELLEISPPDDEFERMKALMAGGDKLREYSENGEGVGAAIIAEIRRRRANDLPTSTAYIIDSLKNPAEIRLLDQIYGRNFYTVSVYLPKSDRVANLKNKIAQRRHEPPGDRHERQAENLVAEDEQGIGPKAQNVRESFPKADFFVNGTDDISAQIKRFVGLIFREPFATPTPDEFHMFVAKAAALRSCDLSRQVGAVIVDPCQAVVSTGCNEVPYPGGGIFYEGRSGGIGDNRDWTKGHDPNYIEIQRTLIEFIDVLKEAGYVQEDCTAAKLADRLLHGRYRELMKNARVRNLIEFGRVVHAEMHALSQAAMMGRSVRGATMYVTTFPCHGCARHIIASGVSEVVFIEPYPKSLTEQLYDDEIELVHRPLADGNPTMPIERVRFRPFHGVAPTLYQRVFAYRDRKNELGIIANWAPKKAMPVGAGFGVERSKVETSASNSVAETLEKIRVSNAESDKGGN